MELLENKPHPKPDIFSCIKILQCMSRLFGMNYYTNGFGLNIDSLVFTMVVIWYGACFFGIKSCWAECNRKISKRSIIILLSEIRIVQLAMIICIIKFGFSNVHVNRMLFLGNRLGEKNAGFVSAKYHRRNLVIMTLFSLWILSKFIHLIYLIVDLGQNKKDTYLWKYVCIHMNSWPLMILGWQFLVWMQVFSLALKTSLDKLVCATISSQEAPAINRAIQIVESMARVKIVLDFKEEILHVYGFSIVLNQLRSSIWIILNAYWYSYKRARSRLISLTLVFVMNSLISFLPHWVGQEISSESTEMLYNVLQLQVTKESWIVDKKVTNFLFGLLHRDLRFRVCNIFNLNHRQFLTFLSLSIGFLIIQLQLIV